MKRIRVSAALIVLFLFSAGVKGQLLVLPADKVMRISQVSVEFEHHGVLPLEDQVEAYHRWEGQAFPIPWEAVKVGFKEVVGTVRRGKVIRLDVYDPLYIQTMRVALTTEGFAGLEHEELVFESTSQLFVEETGTGRGFIVAQGQTARVFAQEGKLFFEDGQGTLWEFKRRLYLWADPPGLVQINSWQRGTSCKFYPQYRGRLELTIVSPERFLAINEVSLEEYLYQVVPSEMPVSWPEEALKAQAVASRTYAVAQAIYSREGHLGFHVTDSTASQVYNNQPEAPAATAAIAATAGEILVGEEGTIASTYFYSTSPGGPLTSLAQWKQASRPDLEGNSPWYRWRCTFTKEELRLLFKEALPLLGGEITDLKISQRDEYGRAAVLDVSGRGGCASFRGELEIRSALSPARLERMEDKLEGPLLLPSAFFVLEKEKDEQGHLKSVTIYGGGLGHGLGMSQWGAKGLAEAGHDYLTILKRYYPQTHLITHSERLRY